MNEGRRSAEDQGAVLGAIVTVREAVPEDADFLAEGNIRMARETEQRELDPQTVLEGVRAALADAEKALYFVCEVDGQPVGQLMVTHEWSDWRNGDIWWIQSVYVLPECRRCGAFRALYDHVRETARASGVAGLRLYVEHENKTAQAAYQRLGMSNAGYVVMEEMLTDCG